ncbi:MAG: sugar phosphate isomerase/epimerase [Clostridia bacterium]|nr:sugar phosphate isomerase/epimerase [Clostridia bacterium]
MIISTQTDILAQRFSQEEAIRILAGAGYDAYDISLFSMLRDDDIFNSDAYLDYTKMLKSVADECGIVCNQAHAPFPSSKNDDAYNAVIFPRIVRSMEIAATLGAKQIIVHPVHHLHYPEHVQTLREMNHRFYTALQPYCEKFGIRVALENMFRGDPHRNVIINSACSTPEEFCEYLDALPAEHFTACLDIGHCGLVGQTAAHFIRRLGHNRLGALHVHDNDYNRDMHTMPFMGALDWNAITDALAEIRYKGEFTLEADNFLAKLPNELLPQACALMCQTARYLANQVEEKINATV